MADGKEGHSSSWRDWLPAGLLLALLLVAAATATHRQKPMTAALLRLIPGMPLADKFTPACAARDLATLVKDGEINWHCLEGPCSNSTALNGNGTVSAAPPPLWQAPRLQLTRCMLRRFTPEAARKCLAGRPIVMIGDSLTRCVSVSCACIWPEMAAGASRSWRCQLFALQVRFPCHLALSANLHHLVPRYQYLSLTYFLEFGRWPAPLRGATGDPSPLIGREWHSWPRFLQGENQAACGVGEMWA